MVKPLKPIIERTPLSDTQIHENPILNRILQNRGVRSNDELDYSLQHLISPNQMANMDKAVELLERHLRKGSRIVVVGDFDCDGATSTSIAMEGLQMMGAQNIQFIIPDREIHGYGLTPSIVQIAEELEPDLIITVDNGIASFDGAAAVKRMARPCDLLITDHHLAADGGQLPEADAIVNPNQPGCAFPSKCLAGCGVIFYVMMGLRAHLRAKGYFAEKGLEEPKLGALLDLVALGTVADVVPLDRNNRILVEAGLNRIRLGFARPGIRALLEVAGKDATRLVASDMGFAMGPRINAAGRLDDMSVGIKCLLNDSYEGALEIAKRLDDLNKQRRELEADHVVDAGALIEQHNLDSRKGVVLYDHSWRLGVVGIVASRIKERLNRPIICMTDTKDAKEKRAELEALISEGAPQEWIEQCQKELGECEVKGSARSIDGIHLKHVLDHINKRNPEILKKFGGHAMAAGLSVKQKYLSRFMEIFDSEISKEITEEQIIGNVVVDVKNINGNHINIDLAEAIKSLGPWGQMFPEPLFHGRFYVIDGPKPMKEKHVRMTVALEGSDKAINAVCFNCIEDGVIPFGEEFESSFTLSINHYRGKDTLQIMLRDINIQPELNVENIRDNGGAGDWTSGNPTAPRTQDKAQNQTNSIKGLAASIERNHLTSIRKEFDAALESISRTKKSNGYDDPAPF